MDLPCGTDLVNLKVDNIYAAYLEELDELIGALVSLLERDG